MDKKALESKKFKAFLLSLSALTLILIVALFLPTITWPMVTFMCLGMFGICSLCIGYVLPQAKYDMFMEKVKSIADIQANIRNSLE
jgi:uncharacterized membrane protein